jgi:hypothetical protein
VVGIALRTLDTHETFGYNTAMTNKEHAIKLLQSLPEDQDAVVIIYTKEDASYALNEKVSDDDWGEILKNCNKTLPDADMWDTFSHICHTS